MSESLMALMKKGGGSDIERIDEEIEFEFPATNYTKDLYVYSTQGKAPKSAFAEVLGAESTASGALWDVGEPSLYASFRTTDGGSSYTGYFRVVGSTTLLNGMNVSEIGADYVKFTVRNATGYAGTAIHVNVFFE